MEEDVIARYKKAYEQEFAREDNDVLERARKNLKAHLIPAIEELADIAKHCPNASTRLKAVTYIIDRNLGTQITGPDEVQELISSLKANDAK